MESSTSDVGALLRELGLRSTPQRRAILRAFSSGPVEHLSADEVHARASQELPDLGRGTVYSTLAEFTEVGLLAAFGTSEPVRYETNTEPHDHFRCRLCLRLFDLDTLKAAEQSMPRGFTLERTETRAEGTCANCADYERGLRKGTTTIAASGALAQPLAQGIACVLTEGPLGAIALAASDQACCASPSTATATPTSCAPGPPAGEEAGRLARTSSAPRASSRTTSTAVRARSDARSPGAACPSGTAGRSRPRERSRTAITALTRPWAASDRPTTSG